MEAIYIIGGVIYVFAHVFNEHGFPTMVTEILSVVAAFVVFSVVSGLGILIYIGMDHWIPSVLPWVGHQAIFVWTWIVNAATTVGGWFVSYETWLYEKLVVWF